MSDEYAIPRDMMSGQEGLPAFELFSSSFLDIFENLCFLY